MGEAADQVVLNEAPDGSIQLKVKLGSETVWLSLNQMAQLFDRDKMVISRHLHNMFREKELEKDSVVAFFALTAADGKTYQVECSNLCKNCTGCRYVEVQRGGSKAKLNSPPAKLGARYFH